MAAEVETMQIGHTARTLGAGAALYVVMAACSASDRAGSVAADGGAARGDATDVIDAFVDELESPVGEASAGPLPPDVSTEPCTTLTKYATVDYYIAEHAYAGKTANQLAAVQVLVGPRTELLGYALQQAGAAVFVRDGSVAVLCGSVSSGPSPLSVTFILPSQ